MPFPFRRVPRQKTLRIHLRWDFLHVACFQLPLLRHGHYRDILVESGLALTPAIVGEHGEIRLRKLYTDTLSALDVRAGHHEFLHALSLAHPRPSRRAIAWRVVQSYLQSQLPCHLCCIFYGFPVCFATVSLLGPRVVLNRPVTLLHCSCQVKYRCSGYPARLHCLEIFSDAQFGEVASHPVPPDEWSVFHRRLAEVPGQLSRSKLIRFVLVSHCRRMESQCGQA